MAAANYCTFYIIRHGRTDWNAKRLIQGHADSELNEEGKLQAKTWTERLKNVNFDAIYSSDLLRAHQTAQIIALERKIAVKTTSLLRERAFGKYEGKSLDIFTNEIKDLVDKFEKLSHEEKKKHKYPTMESDEETVSRFITFLREIAVAYSAKTVLVVSHSTIITSLLIHLGYISYKDNPHYFIPHNSYIKLRSDGVDFFIEETEGIRKNNRNNK